MKIYIPTYTSDIHTEPNPFCSTLVDEIIRIHPEVEVLSGWSFFWSDEIFNIDILHIMWPQFLLKGKHTAIQLEKRYNLIKEKGIRIVATCHNIFPHYSENEDEKSSYKLTYQYADIIIHLGVYSKTYLQGEFPEADHIIVPHHVYNTLYRTKPTREEGLKKLGLGSENRYVLCMGEYRDEEERELVRSLVNECRDNNIRIISPLYISFLISKKKHPFRYVMTWIKYIGLRLRMPNLICKGKYVPDSLLPYYYAVADVCFIQRKKILNSGNLSMALYMGNVVVGPDIGNVGPLLRETGNPSFNPDDKKSVICAFHKAMKLASGNLGRRNNEWAIKNCTTNACAEVYYNIYKNNIR